MNQEFRIEIEKKAAEVAVKYSSPARECNKNQETFSVNEVIPLSETTAAVLFLKNTGKLGMAFFYRIYGGYWQYFFPTDSHLLGMAQAGNIKAEAERHNHRIFNKVRNPS